MAIFEKNEIKHLEEQIKRTLSYISNIFYEISLREEVGFEESDEEYPGVNKQLLSLRIRDLYYLILAYLEIKEMFLFRELFKEKFETRIANDDGLQKAICYYPDEQPELLIIQDFEQFLKVFGFFDNSFQKNEELTKLKSILQNTDFVLKNCNTEVNNETDIYKQVKWVLGLYYPKCRNKSKARFIQQFKTYNPDILIPELKTAIEYKYVNSSTDNIDDFIDQVKIDATNYVGDTDYENFIAVIYIEDSSIATPEHINEAWKSKRFPKNWELIVINGSPTKKKKNK